MMSEREVIQEAVFNEISDTEPISRRSRYE